jgi:outer membrane lipoprotein-sorting protein
MVSIRPHLAGERAATVKDQPPRPISASSAPWAASVKLLVAPLAVLLLGATMAAAADLRDVLDRWFAAQAQLQTWSADLIQTRSLKFLSQPLVSTGRVWVAAPDRFRWELGQPAQTIALRSRDELLVIYPRLKRAEKYPLTKAPVGLWKDALALLEASFPRNRAVLDASFNVLSVSDAGSTLRMTLQPKSASARKLIREIVIGSRTNDFSLATTELTFADGSSLRNDFTNAVLDQPLAPDLFEPKLGPDFTVVEPLRR